MSTLVRGVKSLGPYMLIELLMPGGTLIAATMWFLSWRRRRAARLKLEHR